MAINPSLRFALLLLLLHATVAVVISVAVMPLAARLALLIPILLSLLYYLARDALLRLPESWCEISLTQDTVLVVTRDGSDFSGKVASNTTVSPYFVVLCIKR